MGAYLRRAEDLGFECAVAIDHLLLTPPAYTCTWLEPVAMLSALAGVTRTIRLGTMVLVLPLRNPAYFAKEWATLDLLSGGRTILGVGVGWHEDEFRLMGVPHRERGRRMDEMLEAVTALWAGDNVTYEGKYYRFENLTIDPKPAQKPHPPIWIGGGGEQITLRVVARLADKSNFGGKPHEWEHKRDVLHGHCKDVGRDPAEIELTWSPEVCVRDSEDEIRALVEAGKASRWGEPYDSWQAGNLVGTPDQVCEKVRTYIDLGCTYFVPWCSDYPDDTTLRVFADKVMPEFK
jgi:probable F420-dependent oxidoreductase